MPTCALCEAEFEATSPLRRYCSGACRRRRWELANPVKKRAGEWVWQCQNRGRIAAVHRAWYVANRERALETSRQWTHWNRERKAAYERGRRAKLSRTDWSDEDRAKVAALLAGVCAYCGAAGGLTLDHVVPLSRGGTHRVENLVAACKACNSRKGARSELEFRALLALESFIEERRRGMAECEAPYRVLRSCRVPRHEPVGIRDTDVGSCNVRWTPAA